MAKICPECGKEIQESSQICEFCGYEQKSSAKSSKRVLIIALIAVLIVAAVVCIALCVFSKPIPFSDAKWHDSQEDIISKEGSPNDQYLSDNYGYCLKYENKEFDGYTGDVLYFFEDGELTRVFFQMNEYNENTINHFVEKYTSKYGTPDQEIGLGSRWDRSKSIIVVEGIELFGGIMNIVFIAPDQGK